MITPSMMRIRSTKDGKMGHSLRINSTTPRGCWKAVKVAIAAIGLTLSSLYVVQATPQEKGDINGDFVINVEDVTALGNLITVGDINGDGAVTEADLQALAQRIADGMSGSPPKEVVINLPGDIPLVLERIPAGSFVMGSPPGERGRFPDEGPERNVTISQGFYMGKYEVTQAQWLAVMGSWPGTDSPSSAITAAGPTHPAYFMSWLEHAGTSSRPLNGHIASTGQGPAAMRLPTEAEWEYAARARTTSRFSFGDSLSVGDQCEDDDIRSQYMWYCGNNSTYGSKPVGQKLPNAYGLYDMHGNVWEWCQDWYGDYPAGDVTDPTGPASGLGRVVRGGGWGAVAGNCRSALRSDFTPSAGDHFIGFRVASVR
jgi:formylglycine-generating enzyme required for sulfatase activity